MFKKVLSCFFVLLFILSASSCNEAPACSFLMTQMLAVSGEDIDGNGYLYYSSAEEGSDEYFSHELYSSMYGEDSKSRYFSKIEDFAVFISQRTAGELAVFKCYSRSDADDVANMCLVRADRIKVALRGSEYAEKSKNIKVGVYGDIVVFYFVEQPQKAENKLKGLI